MHDFRCGDCLHYVPCSGRPERGDCQRHPVPAWMLRPPLFVFARRLEDSACPDFGLYPESRERRFGRIKSG